MPQGITPIGVLNRVRSETPWLFQTIEHINATLTNIDVSHDQLSLDGKGDRNGESEAGDIHPQLFPGITALLLLSDLKWLTIDRPYCPEIPAVVEYHRGHVYFQQLQVLHIKNGHSNTLQHLRPYLLLPKLKSLIMHTLREYIPSSRLNGHTGTGNPSWSM